MFIASFFKTTFLRLFTARVGVFCILHMLTTFIIFWILMGLNVNPTFVAAIVISYIITPFWLFLTSSNLSLSKYITDIVYKDKNQK